MSLRDEYEKRIADGKFETAGFVKIVCLDDVDTKRNIVTAEGTIVPVARREGGIKGHADPKDRKYGEGVTRREISRDPKDGGFKVAFEMDNYRPDGDDAAIYKLMKRL